MAASHVDPVELAESAAHTQVLFRCVNDQVHRMTQYVDVPPDLEPRLSFREWLCECCDDTCRTRVTLSATEYEVVRANPLRLLVAPSDEHVDLRWEKVVERHSRYWVIEKVGRGRAVVAAPAYDAA